MGEVLNLLDKWEGCILTGLNVWLSSNHIQQGALSHSACIPLTNFR